MDRPYVEVLGWLEFYRRRHDRDGSGDADGGSSIDYDAVMRAKGKKVT